MDQNWMAYLGGRQQSFNPYSAGNKQYGNATNAPNSGPVSVQGQNGYDQREFEARARRNAMLRRMQAGQSGNYNSSAWLKGQM